MHAKDDGRIRNPVIMYTSQPAENTCFHASAALYIKGNTVQRLRMRPHGAREFRTSRRPRATFDRTSRTVFVVVVARTWRFASGRRFGGAVVSSRPVGAGLPVRICDSGRSRLRQLVERHERDRSWSCDCVYECVRQ